MFMSLQQHNTETVNKSFENVTMFKYLLIKNLKIKNVTEPNFWD